MSRLTRLAGALLAAAGLVVFAPGPALAKLDASRPTDGTELASRIADGPIVVLAHVASVEVKADIVVERVLRGRVPPQVTVAFRGLNMGRDPDTPAFRVEPGERAIFVLAPWTDSNGDIVNERILMPVGGYLGKIPIPAEGGTALLAAVEEIAHYQDVDDGSAGTDVLGGWVAGNNPWLLEAGLEEVARLGIADASMARSLLARSHDASPKHRARVVEALGTALERGRLEPRPRTGFARPTLRPDEEDALPREVSEMIIRLARTDPDWIVRRAAVHQLASGKVAQARDVLSAILKDDPSQEVRYEAAASMADLERIAGGSKTM